MTDNQKCIVDTCRYPARWCESHACLHFTAGESHTQEALAKQRVELKGKVMEVFHEFVHNKLLAGTEAYNAGKKLEAIFDE